MCVYSAASWNTPDEAYFAALQGLPEPYTQEVISELVKAALLTETEAEREEAWAEILQILHEQVSMSPDHHCPLCLHPPLLRGDE